MNTLFSLDGRLSVCAKLVRQGAKLADVGTDHAYLPVWLAKNGLISSAIASDIREKPLMSGADNIEKYGCGDIVSTRLCSGLDGVSEDEADDIVMAGMGGELIAKLIENAPWLKNADKRLILQPMTKAHSLREYLCENGFTILSETPCTHGGKYYTVIHAMYTGTITGHPISYYYTGELDVSDLSREYIAQIRRKLVKKRNGALASGENAAPLDEVIRFIDEKFFQKEH